MQNFDAVFTLTSGGLGTANLPYAVYNTFFAGHEYGQASAAGVLVVIGSIVIGTFALRVVSTLLPRGEPLMRRSRKPGQHPYAWMLGVLAWGIGLLFVAPVLWMVLTSLHSEGDAATNPPSVGAELTMAGYREFFDSNPWPALINSATAAIVSTLLVLALATPAAYALSIRPVRKWSDVMFFSCRPSSCRRWRRCCRST